MKILKTKKMKTRLVMAMAACLLVCAACPAQAESEKGGNTLQLEEAEETMKEYTISRVNGEIDWEKVPELSVDTVLWEPDYGIRAKGQLCYDENHLYVHLQAVEEDIKAEYTEPLSPVYKDSCLEFFFMPETEDRYMNFEINPNGCLYIGIGHGRQDHVMLCKDNMQEFFDIRTGRTADGWEVFYRIPLDFLRVFFTDYAFSGALRANVYKCGDGTAYKHYLSWNPVDSEKPDFHRPQNFGRMEFQG